MSTVGFQAGYPFRRLNMLDEYYDRFMCPACGDQGEQLNGFVCEDTGREFDEFFCDNCGSKWTEEAE